MRILTFYENEILKLGASTEFGIVHIDDLASEQGLHDFPADPKQFYNSGFPAVSMLNSLLQAPEHTLIKHSIQESDIKFGPCIPSPGKIVCVGLNYKKHAEEAGMQIPKEPILFSKYTNTIASTNQVITLPNIATEYDYEVELAFVLGKRAQNIDVSDALQYILGYCNANDLSARDLQLRTGQWMIGKTLDGFLPVGPYLVTSDEVLNPQNLPLKCWRNEELVQDSSTEDMIFSVAEITSHISRYMTLEAGDLVITGTPEGVIFGTADKNWLQERDQVQVQVGDFGMLSNTFTN